MTQRQATAAQLDHLNRLRVAKGYVRIHDDDWVGVGSGQAAALIEQWKTARKARTQ